MYLSFRLPQEIYNYTFLKVLRLMYTTKGSHNDKTTLNVQQKVVLLLKCRITSIRNSLGWLVLASSYKITLSLLNCFIVVLRLSSKIPKLNGYYI
jgi:hypothetical protein